MKVSNGYGGILDGSRYAAVALLVAAVAGCGGGGGKTAASGGGAGSNVGSGGGTGTENPGPPDVTVPTVTSMTPIDDTQGFSTNDSLTATFSEAVNPDDVNIDSIRLTDGEIPIPGVVSFDANNHIARFFPDGGFAPNKRYTITVITGIRDLVGNPLMTDFAWCFETGAAADVTAPSVTSTIPANTATGVAINRNITATFNEDMNSTTLTPASFTVTGPGAAVISGKVHYLGGTAMFSPAMNLAMNTLYTATIGTAVSDLAGNAAQGNTTWSFTTGANADVDAPVVASTSPANLQKDVAIGTFITVQFNEPMDSSTVTTENFLVTDANSAAVVGTVAFDAGNNTATFTRINHLTTPVTSHPVPVSNLEPNTLYTATLTTGVTDMAGNALAANVVWSFTTAP